MLSVLAYLYEAMFGGPTEQLRRQLLARGLSNHLKLTQFSTRIASLAMMPLLGWTSIVLWMEGKPDALLLVEVVQVIYCYVKACDPLPPCQSKIRQWISSLSARLVPVPTTK